MGNKAAPEKPETQDFHDFSHFSEQTSQIFGSLLYYKNKQIDNTFIAKRVTDQAECKLIVNQHDKFKEIQYASEDMLLYYIGFNPKLPRINSRTTKSEIFVVFETFDMDLEFEICQRVAKNLPFGNDDIWSLIYTAISVLEVFQRYNVTHGNICLNTILVKNYDYKMILPRLLSLPSLNFHPAPTKHYLSDDILNMLRDSKELTPKDICQNDVFSLGLVLLEVCTLKITRNFRKQDGKLDLPLINEGLCHIRVHYGDELYTIIREMLVLDCRSRADPVQLRKIITFWSDKMNLTRVVDGSSINSKILVI